MLSILYIAQRVMWFKVLLLVLCLSQLGLGAAQECEGFVGVLGMTPDQLKKEIQANVAAALREGAIISSGNGTCVVSDHNSTVEKIVDTAIEKRLAFAVDNVIANISNSFEQLLSPIMIKLDLLRLPGSTATLLSPARR